jgi:prefoldin subunit 5
MGELADTDNVLIDIGTGYYVQKVFHSKFVPTLIH